MLIKWQYLLIFLISYKGFTNEWTYENMAQLTIGHWKHSAIGVATYGTYIYINANPSIFTERYDQCGNQHYSRELLMMGLLMLETCWAYKKYNKITSGI